jgi:lipopolysaccharide export system permease protein
MWILDRERYWSFAKAYFICFFALVGLYVVIDAFSQVDEFTEWTWKAEASLSANMSSLCYNMGRYYLIKMSLIYDQICGIITMMAAIFTVTWMQRNNELLAMLAAGVSTHRVIRPVLVSAVVISGLAVVNQELIMPRFAEELQRPPDDDGTQLKKVYPRQDNNEILVQGSDADRALRSVARFYATIPVKLAGELIEVFAREAIYIPDGDLTRPEHGGWVLYDPRFILAEPSTRSLEDLARKGVFHQVDDPSAFPQPKNKLAGKAGNPVYFLKTDLTFSALTRSAQWYHFAPTLDLIRALSDPSNLGERDEISIFLHSRIIRPLLGFNLMLLSLPLVLGGAGRNMFVNLGMSLGTSGLFYSAMFLSQYLGGHEIYSAEMAAWAPLIVFGTIAAARWDTIRT